MKYVFKRALLKLATPILKIARRMFKEEQSIMNSKGLSFQTILT